ncbi:unnamed protein product [Calypogeia fissa]
MFGGMMDPEMMRLAQEQISRMRPEDLQKMQQQMMSNPDLLRMASEGMKNIRPEDLRMAAEQMKNIPPEQIADMSSRMANATPEEIASMRAQTEAQRSYAYQGALNLKTQGNQLHGIGKYSEAAEKYLRAKDNLLGMVTPDAKSLQLTCSLNLMSCYLKTKQYEDVITEGTEVLKGHLQNVKAFYRRGQAYKELKKFKLAVSDLEKASELSPEDETIAETLRQAREELEQDGDEEELVTDGPIIEEITDEEAERFSSRTGVNALDSSNGSVVTDNGDKSSTSDARSASQNGNSMGEGLSALTQNPEMIRGMHTMMSTMNPEHLAAMTGGGMTPDMAKLAADMVKNMSPEDLEKMVGMASQFQPAGGAFPSVQPSSAGPPRRSNSEIPISNGSIPRATLETASNNPNLSQRVVNSGEAMPSMADFSPEMQEQVRQQMKDPAMKQMMASMMKSMTPEAMASMSEQLGMKLSPEEAAKAQAAMANLSPDDLDRIMKWADRAQRVAQQAMQAKNWLLGRPGLILALVMLILAVILHRLGYIG